MPDLRRVTIIHPNGAQKTTIEAPLDVSMERLLPALAGRLGLPTVDRSGQAMEYRLAYRRNGEEEHVLNPNETFASAGVENDDALRLYADIRAGGRSR